MGYEMKLLVGYVTENHEREIEQGELVVRDDETYRPFKKDSQGDYCYTGRTGTWFKIKATVDLGKCGESKVLDLDAVNEDKGHFLYWYLGNDRIIEDKYGVRPKPIALGSVIVALTIDCKQNDYPPFHWALALLESMCEKHDREMFVLVYGY